MAFPIGGPLERSLKIQPFFRNIAI